MAGEILVVELRIAAKSQAVVDSRAMLGAVVEMAAGEPLPTQNQEEAQTCRGTVDVWVKQEKKEDSVGVLDPMVQAQGNRREKNGVSDARNSVMKIGDKPDLGMREIQVQHKRTMSWR